MIKNFKKFNESLSNDVEYYLDHLKDDGFLIQVSDDFFRIFKTISSDTYKYDNLKEFNYNEISDDVNRFLDTLDNSYTIDYIYVIKDEYNRRLGYNSNKRVMVQPEDLPSIGNIKSLVIGVK